MFCYWELCYYLVYWKELWRALSYAEVSEMPFKLREIWKYILMTKTSNLYLFAKNLIQFSLPSNYNQ